MANVWIMVGDRNESWFAMEAFAATATMNPADYGVDGTWRPDVVLEVLRSLELLNSDNFQIVHISDDGRPAIVEHWGVWRPSPLRLSAKPKDGFDLDGGRVLYRASVFRLDAFVIDRG